MGMKEIEEIAKKYYPIEVDTITIATELNMTRTTITNTVRKMYEKPLRCKNLTITKIFSGPGRGRFLVRYKGAFDDKDVHKKI